MLRDEQLDGHNPSSMPGKIQAAAGDTLRAWVVAACTTAWPYRLKPSPNRRIGMAVSALALGFRPTSARISPCSLLPQHTRIPTVSIRFASSSAWLTRCSVPWHPQLGQCRFRRAARRSDGYPNRLGESVLRPVTRCFSCLVSHVVGTRAISRHVDPSGERGETSGRCRGSG
jgi:hypothetical protein